MKTIDLMPDNAQIKLPKSKPFVLPFEFPYSIVGYIYVSKIIDVNNVVIATLTCTPDTINNIVSVAVSAANAALILDGHRWYLQETRSVSEIYVIGYGTIKVVQVTDL